MRYFSSIQYQKTNKYIDIFYGLTWALYLIITLWNLNDKVLNTFFIIIQVLFTFMIEPIYLRKLNSPDIKSLLTTKLKDYEVNDLKVNGAIMLVTLSIIYIAFNILLTISNGLTKAFMFINKIEYHREIGSIIIISFFFIYITFFTSSAKDLKMIEKRVKKNLKIFHSLNKKIDSQKDKKYSLLGKKNIIFWDFFHKKITQRRVNRRNKKRRLMYLDRTTLIYYLTNGVSIKDQSTIRSILENFKND